MIMKISNKRTTMDKATDFIIITAGLAGVIMMFKYLRNKKITEVVVTNTKPEELDKSIEEGDLKLREDYDTFCKVIELVKEMGAYRAYEVLSSIKELDKTASKNIIMINKKDTEEQEKSGDDILDKTEQEINEDIQKLREQLKEQGIDTKKAFVRSFKIAKDDIEDEQIKKELGD
jgi:DNA-directed RNA polymerase beta' subunit